MIGLIGALYIKLVWLTGKWKIRIHPETDKLIKTEKGFIPIFWHRHLLMMPVAKPKSLRMYILVSKNKIGDIAQEITRHFNIYFIRGSARNPKKPEKDKGGDKAFRHILDLLEEDKIVAFTPDGPKGPMGRVKKGTILAAKYSKKPIVPVGYKCNFKKVFKSWDKFILPFPFSRGVINIGNPVYLNDDFSNKQIENDISNIENILNGL